MCSTPIWLHAQRSIDRMRIVDTMGGTGTHSLDGHAVVRSGAPDQFTVTFSNTHRDSNR